MSEVPAVALRVKRTGHQKVGIPSLGCWGMPGRERSLVQRASQGEWLVPGGSGETPQGPGQKSWLEVGTRRVTFLHPSFLSCTPNTAWAASPLSTLPALKRCARNNTFPPKLILNATLNFNWTFSQFQIPGSPFHLRCLERPPGEHPEKEKGGGWVLTADPQEAATSVTSVHGARQPTQRAVAWELSFAWHTALH